MEQLQREGLVSYLGFTGLGSPSALRQLIASNRFDTIQIPYHHLNPTAGQQKPTKSFAEEDHGGLMNEALSADMGVFAIRVFAGGALLDRKPSSECCNNLKT